MLQSHRVPRGEKHCCIDRQVMVRWYICKNKYLAQSITFLAWGKLRGGEINNNECTSFCLSENDIWTLYNCSVVASSLLMVQMSGPVRCKYSVFQDCGYIKGSSTHVLTQPSTYYVTSFFLLTTRVKALLSTHTYSLVSPLWSNTQSRLSELLRSLLSISLSSPFFSSAHS